VVRRREIGHFGGRKERSALIDLGTPHAPRTTTSVPLHSMHLTLPGLDQVKQDVLQLETSLAPEPIRLSRVWNIFCGTLRIRILQSIWLLEVLTRHAKSTATD
jgi:hypothetical protein